MAKKHKPEEDSVQFKGEVIEPIDFNPGVLPEASENSGQTHSDPSYSKENPESENAENAVENSEGNENAQRKFAKFKRRRKIMPTNLVALRHDRQSNHRWRRSYGY